MIGLLKPDSLGFRFYRIHFNFKFKAMGVCFPPTKQCIG